ncbi:HAMP domain-containing sensor histidine kinase [Bowmanella dokdonensis]|uniref:histidine kinase n=1 Tax=Bowmanella dokdonensis TaxID=751969 RepID=A0A939DMN5_9ALTE|nr:ATP-binding protein [Bowmanella dokdonensis]MBN7824616.1 hypothetical protein [Bowmanella dokdonensis]
MPLPFLFSLNQQSFRRQLLTYIIAGVVLLVIISSLLTSWQTSSQTRSMMTRNASQMVKALAEQSVLALLTESPENADTALQQVLEFPDVVAAGLLTQDQRLLTWRGNPADMGYFTERNWSGSASDISMDTNGDLWYLVHKVSIDEDGVDNPLQLTTQDQQTLGYALLVFSQEYLNQLNSRIFTSIAVTGCLAILVMYLVISGVIGRLLLPLQALSRVMGQSHQSGEHLQAEVEGAKEIRRMAESYNAMMTTLDEQDERLRHHNEELEAKVRIRTRELTQARDAALSSNRHKSEFLANMTHELRTPIQSIIGYVDLVREQTQLAGLPHLQEDLDRVNRNAERLLGMINCVLDLAKIEAGRMEVRLSSIHLYDLLRDIEETVLPLLPSGNNRLDIVTPATDRLIRVDAEKLFQVLINLLSNACKFTRDGLIRLSTEYQPGKLTFKVQDTGIGIEKDKQDSIFDQFRQLDSGENRQFSGTGLGLAISRQFTLLMGGTLSVQSQPGRGATFTLELPVSSADYISARN